MTADADPDVYLMAFACEPGRGSEPGVGYAFARALGEYARDSSGRATVVTRPHRVERIRAALRADGVTRLDVLAVPLPGVVVRLTGRRFVRVAYLLWQWRAVRAVARRIEDRGRPAVVHHVTFATEGLPTFETRLAGRAALVFGPAGSSASEGGEGAARRLRRRLASPVLRRTDVLVAQNSHVAAAWRAAAGRGRVVVEPNIVIEPAPANEPAWDVVVVGRLIPRKRVDLAIRAFALHGSAGRMGIVGDGPLEPVLRRLVQELGVEDRVEFLGWRDRDEVLDILSRARVLLHTSRQEGATWVVGEAQARGAHPVAERGTGADSVIDLADFGTVVDLATPATLASALGTALAEAPRVPTARWSGARLPTALEDWYRTALVISRATTEGSR